jgi:triosephosphate isomerase
MKDEPIIAANWKMYKTPKEGMHFYKNLKKKCGDVDNAKIILGLPFTGLNSFNVESPFYKAAQNCHWENSGAFTGEISISMIRECGAEYVIVGHSERRHIFGEKNIDINFKVTSALKHGIKPILCIGETIHDRKKNKTEVVLEEQLIKGLKNLKSINNLIIAYEPVWAIGTGLTANENQVESAHLKIKEILLGLYPKSQDIPLLYGGSVKPDNAKSLIQVSGVNGFLIGGASLDVDLFASIINDITTLQKRIS